MPTMEMETIKRPLLTLHNLKPYVINSYINENEESLSTMNFECVRACVNTMHNACVIIYRIDEL